MPTWLKMVVLLRGRKLMKRADFVAAIKSKVGNTGYGYGCYVPMVLTQALLDRKALQFPSVYTAAYKALTARNIGKPVADCVGLIKGTVWVADFGGVYQKATDLSANGMFARCTETGTMDKLPEIPGLVLHKPGHIGVYIGNGQAVESAGVRSGVVQSAVAGRGWTGWGKCHLITYTPIAAPTQEEDTMLKPNDNNPRVGSWQYALEAVGFWPAGVAHNTNFGPTTTAQTNAFKASVGLPQDGIVDEATWAKMADALRAKVQPEDVDCHAAQALVTAQAEQLKKLQTEIEAARAESEPLKAELAGIKGALRLLSAKADEPT